MCGEIPCNNAENRTKQGETALKYFIINVKSMTQAEKARLFLARHGIKSAVQRTTGRGGCSFTLRIYGEPGQVCPLLSQAGVSCDISG